MHAIAEPASLHLAARELRKGFGDGPVLDGVSLTVRAGQRLAVIGENGSGKSTLLRLLAGAIEPDAGVVIHTTDRRLVEQELVPAGGSTVADLRADAIAWASRATAELEAATAALSAGAAGADDRYAAALTRVERLDAWGAERRLARSLAAFDADFEVRRPLRELSVGQRSAPARSSRARSPAIARGGRPSSRRGGIATPEAWPAAPIWRRALRPAAGAASAAGNQARGRPSTAGRAAQMERSGYSSADSTTSSPHGIRRRRHASPSICRPPPTTRPSRCCRPPS
jgi:ABC transporter